MWFSVAKCWFTRGYPKVIAGQLVNPQSHSWLMDVHWRFIPPVTIGFDPSRNHEIHPFFFVFFQWTLIQCNIEKSMVLSKTILFFCQIPDWFSWQFNFIYQDIFGANLPISPMIRFSWLLVSWDTPMRYDIKNMVFNLVLFIFTDGLI